MPDRPWYQAATNADDVVSIEPYIEYVTPDAVLSAVAINRYKHKAGNDVCNEFCLSRLPCAQMGSNRHFCRTPML